jgi:hypothetical protein
VSFSPAADRYDRMTYNRCGRSGLKLNDRARDPSMTEREFP